MFVFTYVVGDRDSILQCALFFFIDVAVYTNRPPPLLLLSLSYYYT